MIGRILRGIGRRLGMFLYVVKARPLRTEKPASRRDVDLREVTAEEAMLASTDAALDLPTDAVRDAFARGDTCLGAFDSEHLIGYAWFARGAVAHLDGVWIRFDASAIYINKVFVRLESRGRHIAPDLYLFADQLFRDRGCTSAVIAMEATNHASIRAAERSGARTAGFAFYWNAGPLFMSFSTPGAKKIGFRFYRPTRPASTHLD